MRFYLHSKLVLHSKLQNDILHPLDIFHPFMYYLSCFEDVILTRYFLKNIPLNLFHLIHSLQQWNFDHGVDGGFIKTMSERHRWAGDRLN